MRPSTLSLARSFGWLLLVATLSLTPACGSDDTGGSSWDPDAGTNQNSNDNSNDNSNSNNNSNDNSNSTGQGCVPSGGAMGDPSVEVEVAPDELLTTEGLAHNTQNEDGSSLTRWIRTPLATSVCGDAGLLYYDPDLDDLLFLEGSTADATPESVDDSVYWDETGVGLAYDSNCTALVITTSSGDGLVVYRREGPGAWTRETPSELPPEGDGRVKLFKVHPLVDGRLAVFGYQGSGESRVGYVWTLEDAPSDAWEVASFNAPVGVDVFDYHLAADGAVHAVHPGVNEYPCNPCDMNLYWSRLESDGTWTTEVVEGTVWGDPDDRFSEQASLAVRADGTPLVAACWVRRAVTGSLHETELRVYRRGEGEWCYETVAQLQDGYEGGDGDGFTGHAPHIVLDFEERPFVLFHDRTQWHDGTGANGIVGQPRLAVRSGDTWQMATLYEQPGQNQSPQPLHGFRLGSLAVPYDGTGALVAGVEFLWDTDSIYNQTDAPITYNLMVLEASVTWP